MASPTDHHQPSATTASPVDSRRFNRMPAAVTAVAILLACVLLVMVVVRWSDGRHRSTDDGAAAHSARPVPPPRGLLGAGSCTSSGCHAAAVAGHAAWQSSYTVWATRDPHARAERVLHEPLAARIVELLAARDPSRALVPAHENAACIGCHATGRGPLAHDGVSCESCHGAAGDWLVAHTLPGWRAAGNTVGMVDLADPFVCAQQCAGCHVGGPPTADGSPREVSHDLIAAGHPRLAFELRSFKQAEPPHWQDRFSVGATVDGRQTDRNTALRAITPAALGSAPFDALDEWALGRLGAVHVFLDQIARQAGASARPRAGDTATVWPEFAAFDCYGCHRPAVTAVDRGATADQPPRSRPPGVPRLEPLHWALLDVALPAEAAATLEAFRTDVQQRWFERPDAAAITACLDVLDAARAHVHPALAGVSDGAVANRVVRQVDPANWDEAAAALAALEAVVARAASRGVAQETLAPAVARLKNLRGLLEFERDVAGGHGRFDSPHDYDARAVATELRAIAAALEALR